MASVAYSHPGGQSSSSGSGSTNIEKFIFLRAVVLREGILSSSSVFLS